MAIYVHRATGRPPRPDAGVDDLHSPSHGSKHLPESTCRLFCRHRGIYLPVGSIHWEDMLPPGAARRHRGNVPQRVDEGGAVVWLSTIIAGRRLRHRAPIAARGNRPAVHNLLNYYFIVGRPRAFIDAAVMFYRPPLLDILPIYIIFLALTPFAVLLGTKWGWKYALTGGLALWLFAQFGLKNMVY